MLKMKIVNLKTTLFVKRALYNFFNNLSRCFGKNKIDLGRLHKELRLIFAVTRSSMLSSGTIQTIMVILTSDNSS